MGAPQGRVQLPEATCSQKPLPPPGLKRQEKGVPGTGKERMVWKGLPDRLTGAASFTPGCSQPEHPRGRGQATSLLLPLTCQCL